MKKIPALVWIPAVFILGGLTGYYGPSEELRMAKERAREEKSKPQRADAFGSFASMVNIPQTASHPHRRPQKQKSPDAEPSTAGDADREQPSPQQANEQPSERQAEERPSRFERLSPEDLRARIDEAAELWRTRVVVARAAAVERLGLDEAQTQAFDAALSAMNDKLRQSMQLTADELDESKSMTPELGVRLMGSLSISLAEAYDDIAECADESVRDEVSGLQLVEFIDPSVGEPLIAVQDKLIPERGDGAR